MKRKTVQWVVGAIILVFALTIIAYPILFSPREAPEQGPPVNIEEPVGE